MARSNVKKNTEPIYTHEGACATRASSIQELRRSVMSCMLWENEFYEDGEDIANRIFSLVKKVPIDVVSDLAIEARTKGNLRHAPLWLTVALAKNFSGDSIISNTIYNVIQRADELSEFLSLYWKNGKETISAQAKKGLAEAFTKFDEYALAKYNRNTEIKLRDVLFLCHAKPKDLKQKRLWKRLVDKKLKTPDTWEVELSVGKGKNKKESWERLLKENKLGALAFLRNLRNMNEAGVEKALVKKAAKNVNFQRVLPFRYIAAAHACPAWEDLIEELFLDNCSKRQKLPGKTILVVDVSGSMYGYGNISAKSDITRVQAAGALAAIIREICEEQAIYATAGNDSTRIHKTEIVPPRKGFALTDLISENTSGSFVDKLGGGGIFLVQCMDYIKKYEKKADRIIVITDEQDCDLKLNPGKADAFGKNNYLINIASYKNGISYNKDKWIHIDGFSESVIDYIVAYESGLN